MFDLLMSMHPFVSLIVFLFGITALGIFVYLLGHKLPKGQVNSTSQRMGIFMWRSAGALLAFMLAINFADVRSDFMNIHRSIESEVAQLRDLRADLDRFGTPEARIIATSLTDYLRSIFETEWDALNKGSNTVVTWVKFYQVEDGLLDLQPTTARQRLLQNRMLTDIDEISDHREARIYAGNLVMPWFIVVVIVMFVITMLFLSVYPRRTARVIFVALYSFTIGLVLYSIISMSMPYQGFTQISDQPFRDLHQDFLTYYE
jgi:hypothetical protein